MGLFRWRGRAKPGESPRRGRSEIAEGERHLAEFAASRFGVEAYVEPPTTLSAMTVVLIASDGEWTRRPVEDTAAARALGDRLGIPVYDAAVVGYPQRMREWNRRKAEERKRTEEGEG
jgi:hypothetical protein